VPPEELAPFDPDGRAFLNLNTPEEFARITGEP
jgi:molybdenum cofactor guanylyltransferase